MIKFIAASLFAASLSIAAPAVAQEFEGIYYGSMSIELDGRVRDVPLQISLTLTGDTVSRPNGDVVQVIDGAFLIDGESGAFPFTRVTFDLSDSRLDMRYSRPMSDVGNEAPASFRLVGEYQGSGGIAGRVLSGNRGPIGSFQVDWTRRSAFARTSLYRGRWAGDAQLPGGGEIPLRIQLVDASGSTVNPADMEFEYTPGKLANVRWNNVNFSINNVTIDYLTGLVTLKITGSGSSDLSIEFKIEGDGSIARGAIRSSYRGDIATFELPAL